MAGLDKDLHASTEPGVLLDVVVVDDLDEDLHATARSRQRVCCRRASTSILPQRRGNRSPCIVGFMNPTITVPISGHLFQALLDALAITWHVSIS
jgi:hypothetical protein